MLSLLSFTERFGHYLIFQIGADFDAMDNVVVNVDGMHCQLGRVRFPGRVFNEDRLLAFLDEYKRVKGQPHCELLEFYTSKKKELVTKRIDLCSNATEKQFRRNRQFQTQARMLRKASASTRKEASCWWCKMLGDSIIALDAADGARIASTDQSFLPLCDLLGKKLLVLPHPRELLDEMRSD